MHKKPIKRHRKHKANLGAVRYVLYTHLASETKKNVTWCRNSRTAKKRGRDVYTEWFVLSSPPCSLLFAVLLSIHHVTFFMLFITL